MKHTRYILLYLILLIFLNIIGTIVFADETGFTTDTVSEGDAAEILKNADFSFLANEPAKRAIDCFSVNEKEEIAVGCSDHEYKTVCVYTNSGDFLYGYRFRDNGTFGVELKEDILYVYLVRGSLAVALEPNGQVKSFQRIQNTTENNAYWNNSVYTTSQTIGDREYIIRNKKGIFLSSSYSQLVMIDSNGEEQTIYDVSSEHTPNMIASFVFFVLFFSLLAICIIILFKKSKGSSQKNASATPFEKQQ